MDNGLPKSIKNEGDLDYYEKYLRENYTKTNSSNTARNRVATQSKVQIESSKPQVYNSKAPLPQAFTSDVFSNGYLQKHQGKLIKVDSLIGNTLDCKIGTLLDVGADFIAIKLNRGCCSMMIPTSSVKYITIIHDNDIGNAFTY